MRGHLTEKADVFSFGVVALEILSGRPNSDNSLDTKKIYLLEWVLNMSISLSNYYLIETCFSCDKISIMFFRHGLCMKITKLWD